VIPVTYSSNHTG